jgi:hypothetical protein
MNGSFADNIGHALLFDQINEGLGPIV